MSRDYRTRFCGRNRERESEWDLRGPPNRERSNRSDMSRRRSGSLSPADIDKRRIRTPRGERDMIDDNILNEISKLPEPSELWDTIHFKESEHSAPPVLSNLKRDPNQSYVSNYELRYSGLYDEFCSAPSSSQHQSDIVLNTELSPLPLPGPSTITPEEQMMVVKVNNEVEKRHRKAALSKQKEGHMNKADLLKKELETLRDQRNELRGDGQRSASPDTKRFLKENTKLQLEIQNKLKTINNVVEMLNGIIAEEAQEGASSEETLRPRSSPSSQNFNYVYYDPELHWCRVCNEFPSTAKDYLNHLHSNSHYETAAQHMEAPWHSVAGANEGFPTIPSAPTKRTPIRGLQFFVPQIGWYCKLCDQFIGDLHCASAHLKSIVHSKNYSYFVQQNPHWETDWMTDRQHAFERPKPVAPPVQQAPPASAAPTDPAAQLAVRPDRRHGMPAKTTAIEDKSSCTVHYTTRTVTVSKEKYNAKMEEKNKRRILRGSSVSSASDSDDTRTTKTHRMPIIEVPDDDSSEEVISINDRKVLENIKSRMKKAAVQRKRSTSRDRELILEMQRKIKESERRGLKPRESEVRRDSRDLDVKRVRRDSSWTRRDTTWDTHGINRDRRANNWDARSSSRDRRYDARDKGAISRNRQERSPAWGDRSPFRKDCSPVRRERNPVRRDRSPVRRDRSPARRDRSPVRRDRSPARTDRSPVRRDRSPARRDRTPVRRDRSPARSDQSPVRRGRSPARRDQSPARRDQSPTRPDRSPVGRDESRERRDKSRSPQRGEEQPDIKKIIVIGKMPFFKSQSEELKKEEQKKEVEKKKEEEARAEELDQMQKMLPAMALSTALMAQPAIPAAVGIAPPTVPLPTAAAVSTPLLMPSQLPIPFSQLPTDAKDLQKVLEEMFPTDPKKCAEKVEQELMQQTMQQQPSLLGAPPPLLSIQTFPPPMGLMHSGMFGYNQNAPLFPPPRPFMNQRIRPRLPKLKQNPIYQHKLRNNQSKSSKKTPTPKQKKEWEARSKEWDIKCKELDAKSKQMDELAMLGIDSSDVGV